MHRARGQLASMAMGLPLHKLIEARLTELGLNWSDLARQVGAHESTVSRWRNKGAVPDSEYMPRIATFLGVDESVVWKSLSDTRRVRQRASVHAAEHPLLAERVKELERIVDDLKAQAADAAGGTRAAEAGAMEWMQNEIQSLRTDLVDVVRALQRNDRALLSGLEWPDERLESPEQQPPPTEQRH